MAIFVGLAVLALGPLGVSSAAPVPLAGSLDPSFGNGGGVVTPDGMEVAGIAVQPDGKIVVAGTTAGEEFWLARYLPDGSLDPSFGDGGEVESQVGDWAFASAIALQPDGKIVVAGGSYQGGDSVPEVLEEFTLARYNPNGSLDTTFGTDGIANTVIPEPPPGDGCFLAWSADASALAITSGGDILAAGTSFQNDDCDIKGPGGAWLALTRYTADGSLDPTFGDGGITQTASPGGEDGIAVQPDGEILATKGTVLIGYASNGSLNLAFDPDAELGSYSALTLQGAKVIVAGDSHRKNRRTPGFLVVARYTEDGRVDSTFGAHGNTDVKRLTGFQPTTVLTENDGKVLIAASSRGGQGAVLRLMPNGRLDTHFGKGGIVSFGDRLTALGTQDEGKILIGTVIDTGALDRLLGGNNCVVPGLRGKRISKASAALAKSYCRRGRVAKRFSDKVVRGRVISTVPPAGARLAGGSKIGLVVSKGKS